MPITLVISGLIFATILLSSVGLYFVLSSRSTMKVIKRRAESTVDIGASGTDAIGQTLMGKINDLLAYLGRANKPSDDAEMSAIREALVQAGYRHAKAPLLFMGAKLFSGILVLSIVALLPAKVLGFPTLSNQLLLYVSAAAVGYFVPVVWLHLVSTGRKERILDGFPDALDLMVVCVEAGLALDAAISRVSTEIKFAHKEIADELNLVSLELRTGLSRTEALRNLSRRVDLEEVSSLVALLVQTDKFGTSVGQALRVHSDAMRVNRQLRAEELAAKLPVKLLFPLIFFIFPSLFVVIIGPGIIKIARSLMPMLGSN